MCISYFSFFYWYYNINSLDSINQQGNYNIETGITITEGYIEMEETYGSSADQYEIIESQQRLVVQKEKLNIEKNQTDVLCIHNRR